MTVAIKVENLSKAYQIGQIGTGTISRDLERWWTTKVMRKDDPFLKLGETNDRTTKSESNVVWSLKDINLEIEQGDAVGIIGRNGAGKSTLLKILSRVTAPTTGSVKIKGRVASLLEVGTGFHPELTGRENIYLNGSILGMRKKEIDRKLDEIVDFSGVERYLDTPVKRYSSGMSVRLAFAVAAHLESEILIVDEVLAVGDAEFQKKCLGKMEQVTKRDGRTILFVSHNMGAVLELCDRGLLICDGKLISNGKVSSVVNEYFAVSRTNGTVKPIGNGRALVVDPLNVNGENINSIIESGSSLSISTTFRASSVRNPSIILKIENQNGNLVLYKKIQSKELSLDTIDGTFKILINIPPLWIAAGLYTIQLNFWLATVGSQGWAYSDIFYLEVAGEYDLSARSVLNPAVIWNVEKFNGFSPFRDSSDI
jgi:lipopolysaccharide transport system ATP-binding protein